MASDVGKHIGRRRHFSKNASRVDAAREANV
jgi:hypothetical protein